MNILALDLGTKTGWALHKRGGKIVSGTHLCAARPAESAGHRWLKFRAQLSEIEKMVGKIDIVYFEDVKNHVGILAAHAYGGFRAHLETWCALKNLSMVPVGVGTVKKNWTGAGNADKPAMIAQAKLRGFNPKDDNEADALAILALAMEREGLFDEVAT